MRLARLDLTRYGKFTDHAIDFGTTETGRPDLHIIYGANESGKSTVLAAYLDLLFGIEPRSPYNFLHPYPSMRIGAAIELGGNARDLVRIKRPQNSLLDAAEQPIGEGVIAGALGGIDREAYRTMFSLDDETLEKGGESILASQGDLGQLLFAASAGLAEFSQTLAAIRVEVEGFYKFHARGGELAALKARLAVLKDQRDGIDTGAPEYARLIDTRDRALRQYNEAIGERGKTQSRVDEIQRWVSALPRLAELRDLRRELVPLADLPEPPAHWADELPLLQKAEIELATKRDGFSDEIKKLTGELHAIVVNENVLAVAEGFDRLADSRARYITAEKDLPERRLQFRDSDREVQRILRHLEREGEADNNSLILGATTVGKIRTLIEKRSGIDAGLEAAKEEQAKAERNLFDARSKVQEGWGDAPNSSQQVAVMAGLSTALAAARADDFRARKRIAEKTRATHQKSVAERLIALKPWVGDVEELAVMIVPEPFELETWKTASGEAQKKIDHHAGDVERLTTERERLSAELEVIGTASGIVSETESTEIRAARERAWSVHRRELDAMSADAFEAILRKDDTVTNARLGHSAEVARLQQTSQSLAIAEASLRRSKNLLTAAEADLQKILVEVRTALPASVTSWAADMSLLHFESWLQRRKDVLETRAALREAEDDFDEAVADEERAQACLVKSLTAVGNPFDASVPIDELITTAQATIDREADRKALLIQLEEREKELRTRREAVAKADAAEKQWGAAWEQACAGCWFSKKEKIPDIATTREVLGLIEELGPALQKQAALSDRVGKMEQDQKDFSKDTALIGLTLGIDIQKSTPDVWREIHDLVEIARSASTARAVTVGRLDSAKRNLAQIEEAIEINDKRKSEMTVLFSAESLTEVGGKLRGVERKAELLKQIGKTVREILDSLRLPSIEEAEPVLDGADRNALELELAELKGRFDDQDQRTRDLFTAHSKATDSVEVVGGDESVAQIEAERRTIQLEIEEKARQYLRLRAGVVAAEHGLRTYRDKHRSSMMVRASQAFQTISRGAYRGLATQPDKDAEILIGMGADGSSKVASELSKGTRFQLYLALRVAGYQEFVQSRQPVPFIADDIMETFDDFRAEEAFRLFGEMAAVGQIIYLTHHRHLCGIAQRVCPGARVHELPAIQI